MKKLFGMLLALVMVLCMITTSFAAEKATSQVVYAGGVKYFKADGTETTNETFPGGDAAVKLSKTVASTGKENEFEVTLQVQTSQDIRELHSDTPDAAVMLILDVSNSMNDCDICGKEASDNSHIAEYTYYYCSQSGKLQYEGSWYGNNCRHCNRSLERHYQRTQKNDAFDHAYVSRLSKAKEAAISFLDEFANETGVEEGDKRWVSIVDFGSTAYYRQNWVDVTNSSQMEAAVAAIENLTVAHSDLDGEDGRPNVGDTGGTNIEGALMLGANIWENEQKNNTAVGKLNYKYTILLTDGNPTFHVKDDANDAGSLTQINGTAGGSNKTILADAKDVGDEADRILNLSGLSRLYSICYGAVGNDRVYDHKPFQNWTEANPATTTAMTIGKWLEAFSTAAYDGSDAQKLFDSFESVISQIQLATQAWKVSDTMGAHAVWGGEVKHGNVDNQSRFTAATKELYWDVLSSDHASVVNVQVGDKTYPVLTYVYKYKITLDNLDKAYSAGHEADTNAKAELTFAVKDTETDLWKTVKPVKFPVPSVQGYAGNLSFKKVWIDNNADVPMEGVKFTLTSKDKSEEGVAWTATETSNVKGEVYFTGIPSGHEYSLTETVPDGFAAPGEMNVSVNLGETTFSKLQNGRLVNEKSEKDVTLVLKKAFVGNDHPDSITFTVVNNEENYNRPVTLPTEDNKWEITLKGLPEGNYVITERAEYPGYDLEQSATLDDKQMTIIQSGIRTEFKLDEAESHQLHTVVFTNKYTQQTGKVSVQKLFKERDHKDLLAGNPNPQMVPMNDLPANLSVTITLEGPVTRSVTLPNSDENWSATFDNLPVGEYTILENRGNLETIQIPDHDYIHLHVLLNDQALTSNKITVNDGDEIALKLENHYTHQMGDIRISKVLRGIDESAIPAGTKFYVDVYPTQADANAGTNKVTTIEVQKLISGEWTGTSTDIPVGEYYLKEQNPAAIPGYDFYSGIFNLTENKVTVRPGSAATTVTLTNTFVQQKGRLTVTKEFEFPDKESNEEFAYPAFIYVRVLKESASGDVVATLKLEPNEEPTKAWTDSVELPLGNYYLSEVTAEGVEGTADVANHGVTAVWDNANVTITKDANENRKVTNTYIHDYGTLTISKKFAGVPQELIVGKTVNFVIYKKNENSGNTPVDTVVLTNGVWTKTITLPVGTYYVYEYGARDAFENYTLTKVEFAKDNGDPVTWYDTTKDMTKIEGYKVEITADGDSIALVAKNTYEKDTAKLTIKKQFGDNSALTAETFTGSIDVLIYSDGMQVGDPVTLTKDNGWKVKDIQLDAGKTYTLIEVTSPNSTNTAYDVNHTLVHTWSDGAEVTLAKNDNTTKTVTNTYTKKTGDMTLTKIFTDILDEDVDRLGTANVTVTITGNGRMETITLNRANNWHSGTITLPVGEYILEEAAVSIDGYTHKGTVFSSISGQVTDGGSGNNTATVEIKPDQASAVGVTLTNTMERQRDTLTISKKFEFEGNSPLSKENFTAIDVLVKKNGVLYKKVTLTGPDWTTTLEDVPTGAYTVEEVTAEGAENTAYVKNYGLHVTYTNNSNNVLVTNTAEPAVMEITNKYTQHVGSIKVEKYFNEDPESLAAEKLIPDTGIAIQLYDAEGNLEATGNVSRVNGGEVIFKELPVGTYRVVEVIAEGAKDTAHVDGYALTRVWTVNGQPVNADSVEVTEGAEISLMVTNTYTRTKGQLKITKIFAGCLDIVKPEILVEVKDGDKLVQRVRLNRSNNWSVTLNDMPTGTYTVVEDLTTAEIAGHTFEVSGNNATVTVDETALAEVKITNTYTHQKANLTITKAFADGSDLKKENFAPETIAIQVMKRSGDVVKTVLLPTTEGAWTVELTDLPVGEYIVAEVIDTAHVDGHALTVTYSDAENKGHVIVNTAPTAAMTVTNSYTSNYGDLKVKKVFGAACNICGEVRPAQISVTLQRQSTVEGQTASEWTDVETVQLNANSNWEYTWKELPVATYRVVENEQSAQVAYHTMTVQNTAELTVGSSLVEGTITNTYTHDNGNLTIAKRFASGSELSEEYFASRPINILVKRSGAHDQIVTLPTTDGAWFVTLNDIPAGAYTVEEVTSPEGTNTAYVENYGLSVNYSDAENKGHVIVNTAASAEMTVTNTYAQHVGNLTITKEFSGLPENMRPEKIQLTVQKAGDEPHHVTLPVEQNGNKVWFVTLENLPVGEYTVTEIAESAQVPGYTVTVPAGQTVNVTEGADVEAKVTNQYEFIPVTGNLTITKAFAAGSALTGDHFDSIKVNVMQNGAVVQTVTLLKSEGWTKTIEVPFGTYTVVEDTASAAAPGYSLSVSYDKTEVTVSAAAGDAVTITNRYTYIPVTGSLNLTKAFQGPQYLYPTSVEFTVTGPAYSQKVTLSAENNWMVTLSGLVPGEYTVTETLTDGYSYDVQSIWSNADGKVQVQAGQMSTLKCTNVYTERPTVSVRIPVEKTVMLAGSIAPDQVFYFSFQAAWQGGPVVMRFENDPSNTAGIFQQTSANTYGVTVKGDGTVKGYIVLEGYTEDLLNGKLQTWEMLSGYATAEEALAAGWTFDKTATDGTVVWNVQLGHDGQGGIQARIARTDGQPTDQVSFLNVHTVPFDPPQTGDEENLLLWMALCGISAMCVLCLVRSKKNTSYQVK